MSIADDSDFVRVQRKRRIPYVGESLYDNGPVTIIVKDHHVFFPGCEHLTRRSSSVVNAPLNSSNDYLAVSTAAASSGHRRSGAFNGRGLK